MAPSRGGGIWNNISNLKGEAGAPGADGAVGATGNGISSVMTGTPTQTGDGYTQTPVNIVYTNGSSQDINILAKNGTDATGLNHYYNKQNLTSNQCSFDLSGLNGSVIYIKLLDENNAIMAQQEIQWNGSPNNLGSRWCAIRATANTVFDIDVITASYSVSGTVLTISFGAVVTYGSFIMNASSGEISSGAGTTSPTNPIKSVIIESFYA